MCGSTHHVHFFGKLFPFKSNEVNDLLCVKKLKLICFTHLIEYRITFAINNLITCSRANPNTFSHARKHIKTIFDLVNLIRLDLPSTDVFKFFFMEHFSIHASELKNRLIIWPIISLIINMVRWPLIIVKMEREDLAAEHSGHLYTFINQVTKVFLEQETWHIVVLIIYDVVYNDINGTYLIVF